MNTAIKRGMLALSACFAMVGLLCLPAMAQEDTAEELAKKLSNPVAALISMPIQANYEENMGPARAADERLVRTIAY